MSRLSPFEAAVLLLLVVPCAGAQDPSAAAPGKQAIPPLVLPQAAEAKAGGASAYNIYSENGKVVRELKPGDVLVVREHKEGGWFAAEIPGGFPCFIHSTYAEAGTKPGTVVVKEDRVLLRPLPSSSQESFPIGRVGKGTELRMLEARGDGWYRVLSPPSVTAWVSSSRVNLLGPPESARARIDAAAAAVEAEWKPIAEKIAKDWEARNREKESAAALARADGRLAALAASYDPAAAAEARAALTEAAEKGADEKSRSAATERLARLDALEAIEKERKAAAELRERHEETTRKAAAEVERKAEEIRKAQEAAAPRPDIRRRFDAIGWVVRANAPPGIPIYRLEKGGVFLYAVSCPSGRYALESFVGKEVGLRGKILENAGRVPKGIQIERLEVLSN